MENESSCSQTQELIKRGRIRKGPSKKWTDDDVSSVLAFLLQTIQNNAVIEKPTAQAYYTKLLQETKILNVTPDIIKNKVRNLRTTYCKAVEWLNGTGQGLLDDNDGKTVRGISLESIYARNLDGGSFFRR
uniref:Myb/SANT-like domain-containing protein n=1 Tax=Photinus pyralis TaxID=7054 RepID=A0A1Y1LS68_PHOPY